MNPNEFRPGFSPAAIAAWSHATPLRTLPAGTREEPRNPSCGLRARAPLPEDGKGRQNGRNHMAILFIREPGSRRYRPAQVPEILSTYSVAD